MWSDGHESVSEFPDVTQLICGGVVLTIRSVPSVISVFVFQARFSPGVAGSIEEKPFV